MIVFQDLYGDVWEVIRRDDLRNFDAMIDIDEDDQLSESSEIIGSHLVVLENIKSRVTGLD